MSYWSKNQGWIKCLIYHLLPCLIYSQFIFCWPARVRNPEISKLRSSHALVLKMSPEVNLSAFSYGENIRQKIRIICNQTGPILRLHNYILYIIWIYTFMIRSKRQVWTHHIFCRISGEYSFCTLELVKLPTYLIILTNFLHQSYVKITINH